MLLAKLQQKAKEKQSLTEQRQHQSEDRTTQHKVNKKRKADEDSREEPPHHKKKNTEVVSLDVSDLDNNDESVKAKRKQKKVSNDKKKKKDQSGVCHHQPCSFFPLTDYYTRTSLTNRFVLNSRYLRAFVTYASFSEKQTGSDMFYQSWIDGYLYSVNLEFNKTLN